jgi:hypothetical protein
LPVADLGVRLLRIWFDGTKGSILRVVNHREPIQSSSVKLFSSARNPRAGQYADPRMEWLQLTRWMIFSTSRDLAVRFSATLGEEPQVEAALVQMAT